MVEVLSKPVAVRDGYECDVQNLQNLFAIRRALLSRERCLNECPMLQPSASQRDQSSAFV